MPSFPVTIHSAEQIRALDKYAIETLGIPGYTLMCRAGEAAIRALKQHWPRARCVAVLCGPGNNGGDGYVLARLAQERGFEARAIAVSDPGQLRGDALLAVEEFRAAGGAVVPWEPRHIDDADVLVDAILGTGLSRPVDASIRAVIDTLNASGLPILAIDIPSGLHADSGAVLGTAVRAHCTVTFIGLKMGFYVGRGPDHVGRLIFDPLGLPGAVFSHVSPLALRIDEGQVRQALPPRPRTAHKGMHGDVLIVGGGIGMAGAARLAGEAALRCGAGRVTVATHPQNVVAIASGRPELMCRGVDSANTLRLLIERTDVIAFGPGLGQDDWAQAMWSCLMTAKHPLVLDADALNLLALAPSFKSAGTRILTPHPAEAGRLLGISTAEIQLDRLSAARLLARRYEAVAVLKGACSIITSSESLPQICDRGNPGMAAAGMGDVLTGVIAGLMAQLQDALKAAQIGVWVHAAAGDRAAAKRGERGLIASDLFEYLGPCVNPTANF